MSDNQKHNVVFVATESDWVYAYDADSSSCQQLWKRSMLGPAETTVPPCDSGETIDLIPEIGVTSTPVINLKRDHLRLRKIEGYRHIFSPLACAQTGIGR